MVSEIGTSSLFQTRITNDLHDKLSSLRPSASIPAIFGPKFYISKRWISLLAIIKLKRGTCGKALLRESRRGPFSYFNRNWFYLSVVCLGYYGVNTCCVPGFTAFKNGGTQDSEKCRNIYRLTDSTKGDLAESTYTWVFEIGKFCAPYQIQLSQQISNQDMRFMLGADRTYGKVRSFRDVLSTN